MEDGPPIFRQDITCPALLVARSVPQVSFRVRGYHPLSPDFPDRSTSANRSANPLSLAATQGISVDFFSSGYLDVSVPRVRLVNLCIQLTIPLQVGFPIRTSWDQSLFANSPRLFAGYNVLHRLCQPRHPSCALSYLTIQPEADRNLIRSRQYLLH